MKHLDASTPVLVTIDQRGLIRSGKNSRTSRARVDVPVHKLPEATREFLSQILAYSDMSIPENIERMENGLWFMERFAVRSADLDGFLQELTRVINSYELFKMKSIEILHARGVLDIRVPCREDLDESFHRMMHDVLSPGAMRLIHMGSVSLKHQMGMLLREVLRPVREFTIDTGAQVAPCECYDAVLHTVEHLSGVLNSRVHEHGLQVLVRYIGDYRIDSTQEACPGRQVFEVSVIGIPETEVRIVLKKEDE